MSTGRDVIRSGRKYLGVPYVHGTPLPRNKSQMDCFNDLGIALGWWTNQINYGRRIRLSDRRVGDLLFFSEDGSGMLTHVGIQSYNGYCLHASSYFNKVCESQLKYIRGLYAARRLV